MGALAQKPCTRRALLFRSHMPETTKNLSQGYLVGLAATILLSFTGILISYLSRAYALPSLVLAFWRDVFVAFGLVVAFAIASRRRFALDRAHVPFFVLYGITLALFNSAWTFSVEFNGAAVATVLAFSSPALTAVLAHFLLAEHISAVKVLAIVMSLIGIVLVSGAADPAAWQLNATGIVFGLLTGLFFAFYNTVGKTSANRSLDAWTTMLYGFGSAIVFLFLFNILQNLVSAHAPLDNFLWLGTSFSGWTILFLLGIGPTIGGYGLYLLSLGYLPATVASLIGALEPAFTAVWAYLIFREQLGPVQLIGTVLVIASVVLLRVGGGRRAVGVLT